MKSNSALCHILPIEFPFWKKITVFALVLLAYGNACVYETGYETPACFWKWFHTMTASRDHFKKVNDIRRCVLALIMWSCDQATLVEKGAFGILQNPQQYKRVKVAWTKKCVSVADPTSWVGDRADWMYWDVGTSWNHQCLRQRPSSQLSQAAVPLASTQMHVPGVPCDVLLINFITSHSFMGFLWHLLW